MAGKFEITIEGLDAQEVITFIDKKSKKFQALALDDIEGILDRNSEEFRLIRKIILDYFNDYSRAMGVLIFGEIEK